MSNGNPDDDWVKRFFIINDKRNQLVQVDADGTSGAIALGTAVWIQRDCRAAAEKRCRSKFGKRELTPLHFICLHLYDDYTAELFFKINNDVQQAVQINARDNLDQPWQVSWRILSIYSWIMVPNDDLSSFVFSTESHFDVAFENQLHI
ncbi:hypothetical protein TKK_0011650 [Trichogramma kaykai]